MGADDRREHGATFTAWCIPTERCATQYRRRHSGLLPQARGDIVPPNVDKEGEATRTLRLASEWLTSDAPAYAAGLQILERLAICWKRANSSPCATRQASKRWRSPTNRCAPS
ncbi:MAG: hypothetical protein U0703_09150 [Anaerolineae bacterium]